MPTPWTAALVRALPDDGQRYELVEGELLVTPSPGPVHQRVVTALFDRLGPYLRATNGGLLLSSPADLALGEDEILQPDLFVVPLMKKPLLEWSQVRELALAIEILSPSTARFDRTLKRRRYQRAGTPEYWIVDPDSRVVERWRPKDERPEILSERLEWRPNASVVPLVIELPVMFAEVWGEGGEQVLSTGY